MSYNAHSVPHEKSGPTEGAISEAAPTAAPFSDVPARTAPPNDAAPPYSGAGGDPVVQQPSTTQPMAIVVDNRVHPNPLGKPLNQEGQRDWNHGLFGCSAELGVCFTAWCCPCIVYGRNHAKLQSVIEKGQVVNQVDNCNQACWGNCCLTSCLGAGWVLQAIDRYNARKRYGIKGSAVIDTLSACCCSPCALTQEHREIEDELQGLREGKLQPTPNVASIKH